MVDTLPLRTACVTLEPEEIAVSDFANDTYSIGGVSKTLAQMWVEDTNWSSFDPATEVSAGTGLTGDPTATTALTAALLASDGFIALFDVTYDGENSIRCTPYADDYSYQLETDCRLTSLNTGEGYYTASAGVAGQRRFAVRFVGGKTSALTDAGAMQSTRDSYGPISQANRVSLSVGGGSVRKITFYKPNCPLWAVML